jgi:cell division protein FtsQ
MARKSDGLTPRQRQSQQIMRDKAARKKRAVRMRRLQIFGGGFLTIALIAGSAWMIRTGFIVRTYNTTVDNAYGLTVDAGFSIQDFYLEGRNRTSMDDINKALGIKKGDPILRFSIEESRERLEKIASVKQAAVERALPDTLYVRIVEREPVALWQHKGKVALVDDNGVVMNDVDSESYQQLPLIVGEDAPQHVRELLTILAADQELAKRFAAAVYVGERRWNIRLESGIEVKLPEENPAEAWKKLADLQAHQQLLERDIKVIDLRLPDRLFIKVTPEDMPAKAVNAKET